MGGSELSERVAKALMDIQDATNLIILDMQSCESSAGVATRFSAIRQYADRALMELAGRFSEQALRVPDDLVEELSRRRRCLDGERQRKATVSADEESTRRRAG